MVAGWRQKTMKAAGVKPATPLWMAAGRGFDRRTRRKAVASWARNYRDPAYSVSEPGLNPRLAAIRRRTIGERGAVECGFRCGIMTRHERNSDAASLVPMPDKSANRHSFLRMLSARPARTRSIVTGWSERSFAVEME